MTKFGRLLALTTLVCSCCAVSAAQTSRSTGIPITVDVEKGSPNESRSITSIEEEMRAKRAIQAAEKSYRDNLGRARDLSMLGGSVLTSFRQKNCLDREDIKKLEKAEKLAKGIRQAAGGSEDDVEMETPPTDLASALTMFAKVADSLKNKVEKTPKHVISAAVIDEANVLLELLRIVRSIHPKA